MTRPPPLLPLLLILASPLLLIVGPALAHGPGKDSDFGGRRVLFIGVDGCRADAVVAAMERGLAPNLKTLSQDKHGLLTRQVYAGGDLGQATHQPTVSGPGWSSLLTGVWMDKHNVKDNKFLGGRFQAHPHFMRRIKDLKSAAWCASFANWQPIHRFIADGSRDRGKDFLDVKFTRESHGVTYVADDLEIRHAAAKVLATQNPDAMFVYFGQVDEWGHGAIDPQGEFSPENELYLRGLSAVDAHIGEVLAAMRARPRFAEEDWLVLVTTDHGGKGQNHGGDSDEERKIWMVAHGSTAAADRQKLMSQPTPQTALVPMIYRHLGIQAPSGP